MSLEEDPLFKDLFYADGVGIGLVSEDGRALPLPMMGETLDVPQSNSRRSSVASLNSGFQGLSVAPAASSNPPVDSISAALSLLTGSTQTTTNILPTNQEDSLDLPQHLSLSGDLNTSVQNFDFPPDLKPLNSYPVDATSPFLDFINANVLVVPPNLVLRIPSPINSPLTSPMATYCQPSPVPSMSVVNQTPAPPRTALSSGASPFGGPLPIINIDSDSPVDKPAVTPVSFQSKPSSSNPSPDSFSFPSSSIAAARPSQQVAAQNQNEASLTVPSSIPPSSLKSPLSRSRSTERIHSQPYPVSPRLGPESPSRESSPQPPRRSQSPLPPRRLSTPENIHIPSPIKIKCEKEKRVLFQCPYENCDKRFTRPFNLKSHYIAEHTSERPYTCDHCQQSFVRLHDLKRHVKTRHENNERIICRVCNKEFARRDALKRHLFQADKPTECGIMYQELNIDEDFLD